MAKANFRFSVTLGEKKEKELVHWGGEAERYFRTGSCSFLSGGAWISSPSSFFPSPLPLLPLPLLSHLLPSPFFSLFLILVLTMVLGMCAHTRVSVPAHTQYL